MSDLVERYVYQVGRYLPRKDRADIEAELQSQIQDQLEDRYGNSPSDSEITSVLAEYGHPYEIASSYGGDQYLIGPGLYPMLMSILYRGWLIIPAGIIFLNIFSGLISPEPVAIVELVIATIVSAVQITLIFSAIVILIFAMIERSGTDIEDTFDPSTLPDANSPSSVDRTEVIFGLAFGTFFLMILFYFLSVGGLTLNFGTSNPPDLVPIPQIWLALFILNTLILLAMNAIALQRNQWTVTLLLTETLTEVFGVICLYFILYQPLADPILAAIPALQRIPFIESAPEIIAVVTALGTVLSKGNRLVALWTYHRSDAPSFTTQATN